MTKRKRVDLFFNPEKEQDLIDYLESSKIANATLIKDLMRVAIATQTGEGTSSSDIDYAKIEATMRKVLREEGVKLAEAKPKSKTLKSGPLGGLGKSI